MFNLPAVLLGQRTAISLQCLDPPPRPVAISELVLAASESVR